MRIFGSHRSLCLGIVLLLLSTLGCSRNTSIYKSHTLMFSGEGQPLHIDSVPLNGERRRKSSDENGPCSILDDEARPVASVFHHESVSVQTSSWRRLLPNRFFQEETCQEYKEHLDQVFNGLRSSEKKKVLIYIHGGLNDAPGTLEREHALLDPALCKEAGACLEEDGYYPIFINWSSSLQSSYRDHLFRIRQGQVRHGTAISTVPFIFAQDVITALASLPSATAEELTDASQARRDEEFRRSYCRYKHDELGIDTYLGQDCRPAREKFYSRTKWFPFGLLKLFTLPVIDGFGQESWDILLRRTNLLFEREGYPRYISSDSSEGDGALVPFFRKLRRFKQENPDLEITVIGHSMGAIILNKALRHFGDLPVEKIVYMAAACSIQDYQETIFGGAGEGYLRRPENSRTELYHLTLQERAEVLESRFGIFEVVPRGSLLVWIDNFLEDPQYRLHRTAGRIFNLMREIERTPSDLKPRIHIKSFDFSRQLSGQPQAHGAFDEGAFWRADYWEPKTLRGAERIGCREVLENVDCSLYRSDEASAPPRVDASGSGDSGGPAAPPEILDDP